MTVRGSAVKEEIWESLIQELVLRLSVDKIALSPRMRIGFFMRPVFDFWTPSFCI